MKLTLTHKEANLVTAILWELTEDRAQVFGGDGLGQPIWRLTEQGDDICRAVIDKLEDANHAAEAKAGRDRDLSGAPKGTIQEARWER